VDLKNCLFLEVFCLAEITGSETDERFHPFDSIPESSKVMVIWKSLTRNILFVNLVECSGVLSDIVTVRLGPQRARDELSERSIDNAGSATVVFWVGGFAGVHSRRVYRWYR